MLLPQYPFPENKITEKGYYPKLPYLELMKIYDELTALGLYVVPKQFDKKLPKWDYWRKEGKVTATRQLVSADQKHDSISGWNVVTGEQSNRLYVLDLDTAEIQKYGVDPVNIYDKIQTLSPNPFVLRSPANGLHMYYRIPEGVEMLTNAKPPVRGIDGRGNGGQVVTLGGWNRYDGTDAEKKGVADGHTETYKKCDYGVYSVVPDMDMALYEWLSTLQPKKEHVERTLGENYGQTEAGRARIERHMKQSS